MHNAALFPADNTRPKLHRLVASINPKAEISDPRMTQQDLPRAIFTTESPP